MSTLSVEQTSLRQHDRRIAVQTHIISSNEMMSLDIRAELLCGGPLPEKEDQKWFWHL